MATQTLSLSEFSQSESNFATRMLDKWCSLWASIYVAKELAAKAENGQTIDRSVLKNYGLID